MKKYVCGICFNWELGETDDIGVYDSIEDLKSKTSCWESCGIVELEVENGKLAEQFTSSKWIVKMDLKWRKD